MNYIWSITVQGQEQANKLLQIIKPATRQDYYSYSWSRSILTVSRTYILLHTSNSITCILHTELEVQPRLEVCWALDAHTGGHSSRKLLANTIKTRKSFVKRKTPLPYFTNVNFRLRKTTKVHVLSWGELSKDGNPKFATLDNVLQSFGFSFLLLDIRLCCLFILQCRRQCSLLQKRWPSTCRRSSCPTYPTKVQHQENSGTEGEERGQHEQHEIRLSGPHHSYSCLLFTALFLMYAASFTWPSLAECLQSSRFQDLAHDLVAGLRF